MRSVRCRRAVACASARRRRRAGGIELRRPGDVRACAAGGPREGAPNAALGVSRSPSCTLCVQQRPSRALVAARSARVHGTRHPRARAAANGRPIDIDRHRERHAAGGSILHACHAETTHARRDGSEPDAPWAHSARRSWRRRPRPRPPTPHRCSSAELPPTTHELTGQYTESAGRSPAGSVMRRVVSGSRRSRSRSSRCRCRARRR